MQTVRKIGTGLLLFVLLLAGFSPVSADPGKGGSHQVIREKVTWTMDPGVCKNIDAVINGTGERRQEIETKVKRDGTTIQVIDDLVSGKAVDENGATYHFLYVNHSTWVTPTSGSPVSIQMKDLFLLNGDRSKKNNLRVAFNWSWTYVPADPNNPTANYWPPVDNFVEKYTLGEPLTCDPI
jgi:hypothetical protein